MGARTGTRSPGGVRRLAMDRPAVKVTLLSECHSSVFACSIFPAQAGASGELLHILFLAFSSPPSLSLLVPPLR